ncbi:MAG: TonB-dependent receptor plug domain-containing protein, partial [Mucilaginibacter sp.]
MFKSLLLKGRTMCILILCTLSSLVVTAQTRITGKVIGSDDKQPVIGATVKIKGTNVGIVTDVNGTFALSAKVGDVLVITYIGYQPKSVAVTGPSLGTIVLDVTNSTLNEVVVTGYQTQLKKDISGSVATVDIGAAKELNVTSAENLLQGQAAGVTVVTEGAPGSGGQVLIRGIGNLGNSSPLYVIDGFQTDNMSNINPNDIESISILKDAGSTAIYGVKGGNGVILVTTKKGKAGKSQFSYDAFYGSTNPKSGNVWNVLGGADYLKLIQQVDPQNTLVAGGIQDYGFQGPGVKGVGSSSDPRAAASNYFLDPNNPNNDYLIQKFDNGAGTDWFHAIFKAAPIQQHSVTASGANGKNNYLFSLAYTNQQGTLIDTYMKRYQARFNTNFSLSDHVRVGESVQVFYIQNPNQFGNNGEGNAISMSYRMEPQIPVYDIKGGYGGTWDGPTQLGNATNPVADQNATNLDQGKSWNIEGNAYAEADFLKHFTVRT